MADVVNLETIQKLQATLAAMDDLEFELQRAESAITKLGWMWID